MAATKPQLVETDGKEVIDVTMDTSSAIQLTSKRHSRSPPSASPRKRTRRSPPPLPHSEATEIGHNHNEATIPEPTSPVDVATRSHPPSPPPLSEPPLTLREISLLRRLQAKETQVNSLLETLTALSQNPASRPPPPPQIGSSSNCLPFNGPPLPDAATATPISIPKALLPVLAQLRARTQQLVEENTLLRSLLEENEAVSEWEGEGKGKGREVPGGTTERRKGKKKAKGIDLKKVVERMKLLTRENEELGSVLEEFEGWAGVQGERMRFEESVRESHEMIRLLDSDLDLAQTQIALLVDRLEEYQQKFGLLPSSTDANSSPPESKLDDTPPFQVEEDVKTNARSRSSSVAPSSNVPVAAKTEPPPPPDVTALLAILSPESAILPPPLPSTAVTTASPRSRRSFTPSESIPSHATAHLPPTGPKNPARQPSSSSNSSSSQPPTYHAQPPNGPRDPRSKLRSKSTSSSEPASSTTPTQKGGGGGEGMGSLFSRIGGPVADIEKGEGDGS